MDKILMFAGSNHNKSINHLFIELIAGLLSYQDHVLIRLTDLSFPIYSTQEEALGIPAHAIALKKLIDDHSLLVISVPEHNGSYTAYFKNILDWLSRIDKEHRVLTGKKVILFSVSPGEGGDGSLRHTSDVLVRMGASVVDSLSIKQFYKVVRSHNGHLQLNDDLRKEILSIFKIQHI